ncbi:uncharacterized protein [Mytilus edulis]|uniref:uncharacterized protein isoform X2 n=1 Tax=Mytilus edulis TaxID=6550 RepID=UPI0039EEAD67
MVYIKDCQKNILSHLRSLNLSQYSESLTEGQLICHRVGIFNSSPFLSVCPSHRFSLGLCWRKRTLCALPSHTGKCKADRTVTPTVSHGILSQKGLLIPVGSVLCKNCKGELTDSLTAFSEMVENGCNLDDGYSTRCKGACETESTELDNLGETNSTYLQADNITPTLGNTNTCVVTDDSLYLPVLIENSEVFDVITPFNSHSSSQISSWSQENDIHSLSSINKAMDILGHGKISPIKYQVRTNIEDLKPSTLRYLKRKATTTVHEALDCIAPSQAKKLLQLLHIDKELSRRTELSTTEDIKLQQLIIQL